MVKPIGFCFHLEASIDNQFMSNFTSNEDLQKLVLDEFSSFQQSLISSGVNVITIQPEYDDLPDAVFPNNWFSTHLANSDCHENSVVSYPMKLEKRRKERNTMLMEKFSLVYSQKFHLEKYESDENPLFLEGTGALVLDRISKIAYASISHRCSEKLVKEWANLMKYDYVIFQAIDCNGNAVYHTNVVLSIGSKVAVVCSEMIKNKIEKAQLINSLGKRHIVIEISENQVNNFCGNILELYTPKKTIMVMSSRAFKTFTKEQIDIILKCVSEICHSDILTIENAGGGSARCMLAEIF